MPHCGVSSPSVFSTIRLYKLIHQPTCFAYLCREGCFPERTACETAANEDDTFSFCLSLPEETEAKNRPPWMETVKSLVPSALSGKVNLQPFVSMVALMYDLRPSATHASRAQNIVRLLLLSGATVQQNVSMRCRNSFVWKTFQ